MCHKEVNISQPLAEFSEGIGAIGAAEGKKGISARGVGEGKTKGENEKKKP